MTVTTFLLILGIHAAGLAFAGTLARGALADPPSPRPRKVLAALEQAAMRFVRLEGRTVLIGALVVAVVLGVALAFGLGGEREVGRVAPALTGALAALVGALAALGLTLFSIKLAIRGSVHAACAASTSLDRALGLGLRAGGAIAIAAEAVSLLSIASLFGLCYGLLPDEARQVGPLGVARELLPALAGLPLGAGLAALALERGGSAYRTSTGMAAQAMAGLDRLDPRNPALVGSLIGGHLGDAGARTGAWFLATSTSHVALLSLCLGTEALSTSAAFWLPFLIRALLVVATCFALLSIRTEEMTPPSGGLLRGLASGTAVAVAGVVGSAFWLAPDHVPSVAGAACLGLCAAILLGAVSLASGARRRDASTLEQPGPSGAGALGLGALGTALEAVLAPTVVLVVMAVLLSRLGAGLDLPDGTRLTTLLGWSALLGTAPYAFAMSHVGSSTEAARGIVALGALDAESERRTHRLEEAWNASDSARTPLLAAVGCTAWLTAWAVPALSGVSASVDLLEPVVTGAAALGLAFLLAHVGAASRLAARGASDLSREVERQLAGCSREKGTIEIPSDYSPGYKALVDLAGRAALQRHGVSLFAMLAIPVALVASLRMLHGARDAQSAAALSGLVAVVGLAGLGVALAAQATRIESRHARGDSIAPAAITAVAALSAIALCMAPFMT